MDQLGAGTVGAVEAPGGKAIYTAFMGKEDFLKLLVAQLEHQDPLSPMDNREFVAQLAQLSALEQLQNINFSLSASQKVNSSLNRSINSLLAPSLIGRWIKARGNGVQLSDGNPVELHYELSGEAKVRVEVYDSNASPMRRIEVGFQQAGDRVVEWDGKDDRGYRLPDGWYTYSVVATDRTGSSVSARPFLTGKVSGVRYEEEGLLLTLEGGQRVDMSRVFQVLSSAGGQ